MNLLINLCKKFFTNQNKNQKYITNLNEVIIDHHCSSNLYKNNVIVYRCINLISRNISNIPLIIKGEDETSYEKISKLVKQPNEHNNWFEFCDSLVTDLLIYGNVFLFKNNEKIIKLNSTKLEIIHDNNGNPYRYDLDNKSYYAKDNQLLHIKFFNPYAPWKGLSPVSTITKSAVLYDTITEHNQSILNNGGRLSGALISDEKLTQEQRESLEHQFKNKYTGTKQTGKMLILEGGLHWKEMSINPKDMDFNDGKMIAAKEIALAFGVPPVMLGIQDSSFNHYKEARLHFWEDTLLPIANLILNNFQNWLIKEENLKLEYDFSNIPALSSKKEEYKSHIDSLSFLTRNEKRQLFGYTKQEEI